MELDFTERYHQGWLSKLSFIIPPTSALQVGEVKLEHRRHICHDSTRCEQRPRDAANQCNGCVNTLCAVVTFPNYDLVRESGGREYLIIGKAMTAMKVQIFFWHLLCGRVLSQKPKLSDKIKENIISEVFENDPALAASAIRLSFHDCVGSTFVSSSHQNWTDFNPT